MILQYLLLTLGIACLVATLLLVLRPHPRVVACIPAYAGLVLLHLSYYIAVPASTFGFWGVAVLLVAGLHYMSPSGEPDGRASSNLYIGLGAIAGGLLGIIVGARVMVLGVVLGAMVGQYMYSRTPHGSWMSHPASALYWRYFSAKCLPAIVAVAITGISIEGFIFD